VDLLRDPLWDGVAGILAGLALLLYVLAEWRKVIDGSRSLAVAVSSTRIPRKLIIGLDAVVETLGGNGGLLVYTFFYLTIYISASLAFHPDDTSAPSPSGIAAIFALLHGLPFLLTIHEIRRQPHRWAVGLAKSYLISVLYFLVIYIVGNLILGRELRELIEATSAETILAFAAYALVGTIVLPIQWAILYQKAGRSDYRDIPRNEEL
jgi:hypothetical protein